MTSSKEFVTADRRACVDPRLGGPTAKRAKMSANRKFLRNFHVDEDSQSEQKREREEWRRREGNGRERSKEKNRRKRREVKIKRRKRREENKEKRSEDKKQKRIEEEKKRSDFCYVYRSSFARAADQNDSTNW